jgi:hypothetical protein
MKSVKRHPDTAARLLPDGYLLLHSNDDNRVYTLTPLGGLVWEYCDGSNSVDDIVCHIRELGETLASSNLETEVQRLVAELTDAGLLVSPA